MKRSDFLTKLGASFALLFPVVAKAQPMFSSNEELNEKLKSLQNLKDVSEFLTACESGKVTLKIQGEWSLGKVFTHCAQSIEYSLNGFPDMKSAVFRGTVGSVAFSVFSLRGKMSHGLEDPIPGAYDISNSIERKAGIQTLQKYIDLFQKTESKDLKPHFAYGQLDKEEFDTAHTLHIKNHFERISLA